MASSTKGTFQEDVKKRCAADDVKRKKEMNKIEDALIALPVEHKRAVVAMKKRIAAASQKAMDLFLVFDEDIAKEIEKVRQRYWIYETTRTAKINALTCMKDFLSSSPDMVESFGEFIKAMQKRVPLYLSFEPELAMSSKIFSLSGTAILVEKLAETMKTVKFNLEVCQKLELFQESKLKKKYLRKREASLFKLSLLQNEANEPLDERLSKTALLMHQEILNDLKEKKEGKKEITEEVFYVYRSNRDRTRKRGNSLFDAPDLQLIQHIDTHLGRQIAKPSH